MRDYIDELLDQVSKDLKKQKEEAQQILKDMDKDKNLLHRIKNLIKKDGRNKSTQY